MNFDVMKNDMKDRIDEYFIDEFNKENNTNLTIGVSDESYKTSSTYYSCWDASFMKHKYGDIAVDMLMKSIVSKLVGKLGNSFIFEITRIYKACTEDFMPVFGIEVRYK